VSNSTQGASRGGSRRPSTRAIEPLIRVDGDFEDEYPGASALATECYANLCRAADLLMELHNRQSFDEYQLSPGARQVLAIVEGAGEPLEPTVIAGRLLVTTASVTSLLDNLERRGLIRRLPHPEDRRKLLIETTSAGKDIVDHLLPSFHARERAVMDAWLSSTEQRQLLKSVAKLQHAALLARSAPAPEGATRRGTVRVGSKDATK
jgi:DNA-binding MarR family transcriptional regulator